MGFLSLYDSDIFLFLPFFPPGEVGVLLESTGVYFCAFSVPFCSFSRFSLAFGTWVFAFVGSPPPPHVSPYTQAASGTFPLGRILLFSPLILIGLWAGGSVGVFSAFEEFEQTIRSSPPLGERLSRESKLL